MTNKERRAERFKELMDEVGAAYEIGAPVYVNTMDGKVLATVVEMNSSPFLVSCSVTFDLGNGTFCTQMFTK